MRRAGAGSGARRGFAGPTGAAVGLAIVLSILAGCAAASSPPGATPSTSSATASASSARSTPPSDPVDGVVVHVVSGGLADVTAFDLRTTDGTVYRFDLARLEDRTAFPPGHLVEHAATSVPVRVTFVVEGGVFYATFLVDAPTAGPS